MGSAWYASTTRGLGFPAAETEETNARCPAHLAIWVSAAYTLLHAAAGAVWQQALCNTHDLHGKLAAGRYHQCLQRASLVGPTRC